MTDEKSVEAPTTETTVLSQEAEKTSAPQQPELPLEAEKKAPVEKTEEEKKAARDAYQRRQDVKRWKQKQRELEAQGITDDELEAAMRAAQAEGFKMDDEESKKNLTATTKASIAAMNERRRKLDNVTIEASRENLASTLESLGYKKGTPEYEVWGNYMFKRVGVSDPDVFLDKEMVEKEIDSIISSRKTVSQKADPVSAAVVKKASAPLPSSESRVPKGSSSSVKQLAERMGISEEKAAKIAELSKNIPARDRHKH